MKCQELLALLGDYVDGELDEASARALREHLSCCEPCEVVIDNLRQTITVYRCGGRVELPAELASRLHAALRRRWEEVFSQARDE